MSDTPIKQKAVPLGVGAIVGDSFSLLGKHFVPVVLAAFIPTVLAVAIPGFLVGWDAAIGASEPVIQSFADFWPFLLSIFLQLATIGITTGLLIQLAYDAKLGRPLQIRRYFDAALRAAPVIVILSIVSVLLVMIGFIFLVVPGLWVYAVFSMTPAIVVIEKLGFGSLRRSAALTKEYRWPILGAILLVGIAGALISAAGQFLTLFLAGMFGSGVVSIIIGVFFLSLISAIYYGLSSICIALIYARLREIKEGVSVRDIAAVFE